MSSLLSNLLSYAAAGALLVSGTLDTAAPQNADGPLLLVNKTWTISTAWAPDVRKAKVSGSVRELQEEAAAALEEMFAACRKEAGVTLVSVSGYRSAERQAKLYQSRLKGNHGDEELTGQYVALPGTSEHQTGLCIDIAQKKGDKQTGGASFAKTKGGKWVAENAYRFGFIIRYPEGQEDVTGYSYEPWHIRYIGTDAAAEMAASGLPYELWLPGYRTQLLIDLWTK